MIGVSNYHTLSFAQVASASGSRGQKREPKICEGWRCGRLFFRAVPESTGSGEILCPVCRHKEELRKLRKGVRRDR